MRNIRKIIKTKRKHSDNMYRNNPIVTMIVMIIVMVLAIFTIFFGCARAKQSEKISPSSLNEGSIGYEIIAASNNIKLLEITYDGQTHQYISLMMGPVTWSEPQHWPSCKYCDNEQSWETNDIPQYSLTKPLPQVNKIHNLLLAPTIKGLEYPKTQE